MRDKSSSVKTVFLSSVAQGLEKYRDAVYDAIEGLAGYHCVRMEDFGALADNPKVACATLAHSSDVFVGIVGQRYGSSPPDDDRSMTEIEYDAACEAGSPRLMFAAPEEFPVPANLIETDDKRERLVRFRRRVLSENTVAFFESSADLETAVLQAFHNCRELLLSSGKTDILPQALRTYLLFPFVTTMAGFDTGISISNTGAAPFGTAGESGVCTFHYYGSGIDGFQPASQSSCMIRPGETLTYDVFSGGGSNGARANLMDNRAASFQGYVIAECHFRYAYGFAVINRLGSPDGGPGFSYLATAISSDRVNK